MRRMTCKNGLVWQGRRARFVFVAAMGLGLMVTSARGGSSLDSPAAPTNPASAMWTLNDIYNVLDTRTTNVTRRTVTFAEPGGEPTNGTMHTLNDIMTLVTTRAPETKTGETVSYAVGDAGWYSTNVGMAWPNPRFSPVATNGAETNQIRDNLTRLIWARDANLASNSFISVNGTCTWDQAFDVITNSAGPVNGATYGGTNDWRLPNVRELLSLIAWQYSNPALSDGTGTNKWTAALGPFVNVQSAYSFWSGTTQSGTPTASNTNYAWYVYLYYGTLVCGVKTNASYYVWPVRGGGQ